jgi:hypothetical protein
MFAGSAREQHGADRVGKPSLAIVTGSSGRFAGHLVEQIVEQLARAGGASPALKARG